MNITLSDTSLLLIPFLILFITDTWLIKPGKGGFLSVLKHPEKIKPILLRQTLGIALFGFTYLLLSAGSLYLPVLQWPVSTPVETIVFSIFCCLTFYLANKEARIRTIQNPSGILHSQMITGYLTNRLIFLLGYEFYFRGVLFLILLQFFPVYLAILINLFLYYLIHIRDEPRQRYGSIPFGLLLCLVSLRTGSVWPAFILHTIISLGYELPLLISFNLKTKKS